jgi:dTDP-4-amino-4,6-dideoxygalactose transaminase
MFVPFGTISIPETSGERIGEILQTKRVSSGKYVRMFEESFADLLGVKEAIALSSGTDADILALAVLHDYGAKRGDEVILPALSFVATGNAVLHAGFKPVFRVESYSPQYKGVVRACCFDTLAVGGVMLEIAWKSWLTARK